MVDLITFRAPAADDAADLWRLARDSGSLDLNSPYAYLLWCTDFADSTVVASAGTEPIGFVGGHRPPNDPDCAFVWQVAVAPSQRGSGLGRRLLLAFLARPGNRGATWLTATVTPSNAASLALFRGTARHLGVRCEERERFPAEVFPAEVGAHEPEIALRIGPLPPD
ncbi:diaminobutyrate acetyltransferase [Egicoccus sp. AB-alg6-2]|uniref:diaminobutyrate acetyltransferase n=1 Tax=Egicoccus sp. AB-alg6-2 TaxID=3242692 RepID=UPI00359DBA4E